MNCIAFVPVRCGSKSIPFKNIKLFCGRPLLFWNLLELQHVQTVDKVVVATDCEEIEVVVKSFGFSKVSVYWRSEVNATDISSTESVMIEYINAHSLDADSLFMLVQVTSPLTTREHFAGALKKYSESGADSLLSCARLKRFIWNTDGTPINYNLSSRPRRQEFDGLLMENGAIYISTIERILRTDCRISGKISIFEMPDYTSIEIDEEEDWVVAEALMRNKSKALFAELFSATKIKIVATDVDGVLTDAGMYYSEAGDELKKFNTRDGKGFEILRSIGIKTAILTSENTQLVNRRGQKIRADYIVQGVTGAEKLRALEAICSELGIGLHNCAYIGDDINCISLLTNVGAAFCPSDAVQKVKELSNVTVLSKKGGEGVFREMIGVLFN